MSLFGISGFSGGGALNGGYNCGFGVFGGHGNWGWWWIIIIFIVFIILIPFWWGGWGGFGYGPFSGDGPGLAYEPVW
jgi:hypothetical protein